MSEVYESVQEFLTSLDDDSHSPEKVFSKDNKDYENDLYKKWFRSKTQSGFLSIRPWFNET
jgi:hypothetical protein